MSNEIRRKIDEAVYDETGKQILPGDLLKVYHYTARRNRKKHYLYKIALNYEGYWGANDFDAEDKSRHILQFDQRNVCVGAKVVYEKDWETKRKKIKA